MILRLFAQLFVAMIGCDPKFHHLWQHASSAMLAMPSKGSKDLPRISFHAEEYQIQNSYNKLCDFRPKSSCITNIISIQFPHSEYHSTSTNITNTLS